jgi:hypothetical protein
MKIEFRKFGTTLTSRQAGKEAFSAFAPFLRDLVQHENVEVDFDGVTTFSPSWVDEFLTGLENRYGAERMFLLNTNNPSAKATLETLEMARQQAGIKPYNRM